jgi:hypothetical protein
MDSTEPHDGDGQNSRYHDVGLDVCKAMVSVVSEGIKARPSRRNPGLAERLSRTLYMHICPELCELTVMSDRTLRVCCGEFLGTPARGQPVSAGLLSPKNCFDLDQFAGTRLQSLLAIGTINLSPRQIVPFSEPRHPSWASGEGLAQKGATMATKAEVLGALRSGDGCLGRAALEEPVFILRAQNILAPRG